MNVERNDPIVRFEMDLDALLAHEMKGRVELVDFGTEIKIALQSEAAPVCESVAESFTCKS